MNVFFYKPGPFWYQSSTPITIHRCRLIAECLYRTFKSLDRFAICIFIGGLVTTNASHVTAQITPQPLLLSNQNPGPELFLFPVSSDVQRIGDIGPGWQTNFAWHLGTAGTHWVITEPNGTVHKVTSPNESTVNRKSSHKAIKNFLWQDSQGWQHEFRGSYLVTQTSPDGHKYQLHYANRRLKTVSLKSPNRLSKQDPQMATRITFEYKNHRLHRVTDSVGKRINLHYDNLGVLIKSTGARALQISTQTDSYDKCWFEPIPENSSSNLSTLTESINTICDPTTTAPPEDFFSRTGVPGALRLDARPGSCRSYFADFGSIERGRQIERGLIQHTPYSGYQSTNRIFPIVDFLNEDEAIVVLSRDLTSASYQQPESVYRLIIRAAQTIDNRFAQPLQANGFISATELGMTTRIDQSQVNSMTMQIIVQYGTASAQQVDEIQRAIDTVKERYGIGVRIIEIP